jgi:hypothetical protein
MKHDIELVSSRDGAAENLAKIDSEGYHAKFRKG